MITHEGRPDRTIREAGPAGPGHRTTLLTLPYGSTEWLCSCGRHGGQYVPGYSSVTQRSAEYHVRNNTTEGDTK